MNKKVGIIIIVALVIGAIIIQYKMQITKIWSNVVSVLHHENIDNIDQYSPPNENNNCSFYVPNSDKTTFLPKYWALLENEIKDFQEKQLPESNLVYENISSDYFTAKVPTTWFYYVQYNGQNLYTVNWINGFDNKKQKEFYMLKAWLNWWEYGSIITIDIENDDIYKNIHTSWNMPTLTNNGIQYVLSDWISLDQEDQAKRKFRWYIVYWPNIAPEGHAYGDLSFITYRFVAKAKNGKYIIITIPHDLDPSINIIIENFLANFALTP